jgi:hypothetical protein
VLAIVFVAATKGDKSAQMTGMALANGIGAVYIIKNLRKWKRNNDVVYGVRIGWTVALLLAVLALCGLVKVGADGHNADSTPAITPGSQPAAPKPSREVALANVDIVKFTWHKDAFKTIMKANFTIRNDNSVAVKDMEVTCVHSAPSGTEIDRNVRTIYEVVWPHSTRSFHDFDMGLIHSQAIRSSCVITDLAVF